MGIIGDLLGSDAEDVAPALIGGAAGGFLGGPAGAGIGTSLGGIFAGAAGQRRANEQNAQLARDQMAFQERMSSTAHQREVEDLKAAGLNPLLSAGGSGSSSPSGATATMQNAAQGISTAAKEIYEMHRAQKQQDAELDLMKSQKKKTDMETKVIESGVPESDLKNRLYNSFLKPFVNKITDAQESGAKNDAKRQKMTPEQKKEDIRKQLLTNPTEGWMKP